MEANRKAFNLLMGLAVFTFLVGIIQTYIVFENYNISSIDFIYILKIFSPSLLWSFLFIYVALGVKNAKSWARRACQILGIVLPLTILFSNANIVVIAVWVIAGIYLFICSKLEWKRAKIYRGEL